MQYQHPSVQVGLSQGDKGEAVESLQSYLYRFGYLPNLAVEQPFFTASSSDTEPGIFDEVTAAALKNFQLFYGLPVSGVIDEETASLISRPRCGLPDYPSYLATPGVQYVINHKWNKTTHRYKFSSNPGSNLIRVPPGITEAQFVNTVVGASNTWGRFAPLSYELVGSGDKTEFLIRFTTDQPGDDPHQPNGTLAVCITHLRDNRPYVSLINLDTTERWSLASPLPPNTFDLFHVILHEIGHHFGLGHTGINNAVMFAFHNGQRNLTQDDINGIQELYGRR